MEERIKMVSSLISEVKPVLYKCGIKNPSIAFNAKKIAKLDNPQFDALIAWFDVFRKAVNNYIERRKMIPEEQWDHYKAMGLKGLQEQNILNAAKKIVVQEWSNRPTALQRKSDGVKNGKTGTGTNKPKATSKKAG